MITLVLIVDDFLFQKFEIFLVLQTFLYSASICKLFFYAADELL